MSRKRGRPSFEDEHGEEPRRSVLRLPRSLHEEVAEESAKEDVSMNSFIIRCIRRCLGKSDDND